MDHQERPRTFGELLTQERTPRIYPKNMTLKEIIYQDIEEWEENKENEARRRLGWLSCSTSTQHNETHTEALYQDPLNEACQYENESPWSYEIQSVPEPVRGQEFDMKAIMDGLTSIIKQEFGAIKQEVTSFRQEVRQEIINTSQRLGNIQSFIDDLDQRVTRLELEYSNEEIVEIESDKSSSMGGFEESIGTRSTFEEDKVSMDTTLQKTIQLTPIDESDQISSKQEEKSTILQGEFFPHMIHFNSFKNYDASHDRNSPCVDLSRKSNTFETLTPLTTPLHQTPSDEAIRKIRSEVTIIFTPLSTYANRVIQAPISIISNISKGVFRGGRKVAIHVSASFNFEGG